MSIALYDMFLAIQTLRYRDYFVAPNSTATPTEPQGIETHSGLEVRSAGYHALLLPAYLLPVVVLSKQLAVPIDYALSVLRSPSALTGFLKAVA
jgi:Ca2+:H+ antiporter